MQRKFRDSCKYEAYVILFYTAARHATTTIGQTSARSDYSTIDFLITLTSTRHCFIKNSRKIRILLLSSRSSNAAFYCKMI